MSSMYIAQNETHLKNFISLAKVNEKSQFIVLDEACGFSIDDSLIKKMDHVFVRPKIERGVYRVNGLSRLKMILSFNCSAHFKELTTPSKIVIGCDGALQKKIIHYFKKKKPELVVELWGDGLLEKVRKSNILKLIHKLEPLTSSLRVDCYLPSVSGTSSLINVAYVMSESCKNSLKYNGFRGDKIVVAEFPRIRELKKIKRNNVTKRVLFVFSAFSWHGRDDIEDWEISLVNKIMEVISKSKLKYKIALRSHPRSSKQLFLKVKNSGLASEYVDCDIDLVNSDIVISYASTCLYDASAIGKQVYTFEDGAPYIDRGEFVEGLPLLSNLNHLAEL